MVDTARLIVTFAAALAAGDGSQSLGSRLCETARTVLGADGAAITVELRHGARPVLHSTGNDVTLFEHLQVVLGEGPSREVFTSGTTRVVDTQHLGRWPRLEQEVRAAGPTGTFHVVPLTTVDATIGLLTLHTRTRTRLAADAAELELVAQVVATAIVNDPELTSPTEDVMGTWEERSRIHQATGMVMAQLSISATDALELIRARSFALDESMAQVALEVVEGRLDLAQEGDG